MKLLKLLRAFLLFIGFSIVYTIQASEQNTSASVLQLLYTTYNQHQNNFVNYLPSFVPIEKYKHVLLAERERLKAEIDSLSYKNVIFSPKNVVNAILMSALAADELTGSRNFDRVFTNFLYGTFEQYASSGHEGAIGRMYKLAKSVKENIYRGLDILQALAVFVFVKDIKVIRDTKKNISEQIDKCNKMLELLDGVQSASMQSDTVQSDLRVQKQENDKNYQVKQYLTKLGKVGLAVV